MAEDGVGINTVVTAAQRVAQLNVARCAAARSACREDECAPADPLDGHLRAFTMIGRGIDCDRVRQPRCALGSMLPYAAASGIESVVDQRSQNAIVLVRSE